MRNALACALVLLQAGEFAIAGDAVPSVLVKAHEARMAPKTGYLEYWYTFRFPPNAETRHRFTARFSGDDLYLIDHGDEEGIVLRQPDGTPLFGVSGSCVPNTLVIRYSRDEAWRRSDNETGVNFVVPTLCTPFVDPRSIGLHWSPVPYQSPLMRLAELSKDSDPPARYHVEKASGLTKVKFVGQFEEPMRFQATMEWTIDVDKGYSINQIECFELHEGGERKFPCHMTCDNDLVDGYWWPRRVESSCEVSGFYMLFEFTRIEFDRPEHLQVIDADVFGLPIGAPVGVLRPSVVGEYARSHVARYLGGGQIVSEEEFQEIKPPGADETLLAWTLERMAHKGAFPAWWDDPTGGYGIEGVEHRPDEWEAYVRRWIIKRSIGEHYKLAEPLTEKQKVAAWGILADCRKRAMPLVQKRAAELAEAVKAAREGRQAVAALRAKLESQSTPGQSDRSSEARAQLTEAESKSERLGNRVVELELPDVRLIEIFEELKRRLDGLLTAVQRSDANVLPREPAKPPQTRDGRYLPIQSEPRSNSTSASQPAGPPLP